MIGRWEKQQKLKGGKPVCGGHGHNGGPGPPDPLLHLLLPPPHPDAGRECTAETAVRRAEPRQQVLRGADPSSAGQGTSGNVITVLQLKPSFSCIICHLLGLIV